MKLINFIVDLFRLLYISIYKRTKGLKAKSRILAFTGYIFIINMFFNLYLIKLLSENKFLDKSCNFNFGKLYFVLLFLSIVITILFDFKYKKDMSILYKYRKIITHRMFEYIIFILGIILIVLISLNSPNRVF